MNVASVLPAAFVLVAFLSSAGSAQYLDLTSRVPRGANTLLVCNVEQIHASPLAVAQNWREEHEQRFAAGLSVLPPYASKLLMAAETDFDFMQPVWDVTLYDLRYDPSLPKLAAASGGRMEEIQGQQAVYLPTDTYVVRFGPTKAGAYSPGNRQSVDRWISGIYDKNSTNVLSTYLNQAVTIAEKTSTPLVMAMDLKGVLSAAEIEQDWQTFAALRTREADKSQLCQTMAGLQGVRLSVTVRDAMIGKITVDFAGDVSFMQDYAKELLLEVLAKNGAMIDEFANWETQVTGSQVTLEGKLYPSGMRRILSVFDAPPSMYSEVQSAAANPEQSQQKIQAAASQQYWNQLTMLVEDLQSRKKSGEAVTWGEVGLWFERYAKKIDQLPILNVDPDLAEFGGYVASQLRDAERSMKGIGANKRWRQSQMPNYQTTNYRWGRYGYYGGYTYNTTTDLAAKGQERARISTQESIRGNSAANLTMQGVQQAFADMRRHLTQKYQVEF